MKGFGIVGLLISIVVITGLASLFAYGYDYYNRVEKSKKIINVHSPTIVEILQPNAVTPNEEALLGTVTGNLSYPSEGIPDDMIVCAENIQTKTEKCTSEKLEQEYTLDLPAATYYVYAKVPDNDYKAYYTEFVTCGLLASCPSHKKIEVEVKAGLVTKDINPHDWYN